MSKITEIPLKSDDKNQRTLKRLQAYNLIFDYLASKSPKGLLLLGNVGTGKTDAIYALRRIKSIKCKAITCRQISLECGARGADAVIEYSEAKRGEAPDLKPNNYFFDDLGTENQANHYGTLFDPMQDIIFLRHGHFKREKLKTYFTSNLTIDQLADRYDKRITDRLREMCHVISFTNKESLRS